MKKALIFGLSFILLIALTPACSKKGGGSSDSCSTEATLSVTTSPASGSTEAPAPGPDFPLQVTINSTMPSGGVTIAVKAHPDGSSTNYFSNSISSSTKTNNFTITGTPTTVTCVVEITVTSKSCGTNKWTGSYRYSMK